jgi:hypothetical protein
LTPVGTACSLRYGEPRRTQLTPQAPTDAASPSAPTLVTSNHVSSGARIRCSRADTDPDPPGGSARFGASRRLLRVGLGTKLCGRTIRSLSQSHAALSASRWTRERTPLGAQEGQSAKSHSLRYFRPPGTRADQSLPGAHRRSGLRLMTRGALSMSLSTRAGGGSAGLHVEGRDSDAARNVVGSASFNARRATEVTTSATASRAPADFRQKPDSLRSLRAGRHVDLPPWIPLEQ